ncbi:Tn3 family transposase [Streptomyces chryseus]
MPIPATHHPASPSVGVLVAPRPPRQGGRLSLPAAQVDQVRVCVVAVQVVLNAVVLWNTHYLDAAVAQLRGVGHDVKDEDVARLSLLKHRHINFLGHYLFRILASGPAQGLRPLRDPDAVNVEDEETEG